MTRLLALAAAGLCAGACAPRQFSLSGSVTLAASVQRKVPRENAVMYVVAKNRGGVPVAVHRIVNPQFPAKFAFGPDDLIVPELPGDTPLRVEIEMSTHGRLGQPARGDLLGAYPNLVYPGERRIHIVIDRQY